MSNVGKIGAMLLVNLILLLNQTILIIQTQLKMRLYALMSSTASLFKN